MSLVVRVRDVGPVEECLVKAHELVLQGWGQRRSLQVHEHGIARCSAQAIFDTENPALYNTKDDTCSLIWNMIQGDYSEKDEAWLTRWNDQPGRTLQEVSDLFMDAIDIARLENL